MSTPRSVRTPRSRNAKVAATNPGEPKHQTHGGYTPLTGPVLSASQLYRTKNVAKGSPGAFPSMQAYGAWLRDLSMADLHRHAVEEAHIVAIDDRERLIKRLEAEWTGANAREGEGNLTRTIPKREPYSAEQLAELERLKQQMLKGAR